MASGDSKKMLNHCIYNYMKEKGLHVAADVFAVEANLDLGELLDSGKDMLKDWWRLFWPQFSSRLANKARGNSRPSVQPSMDDVIAMLASSEKQGAIGSQQALGGNPPQNVIPIPVTNQLMIVNSGPGMDNFMENPPVSSLLTPPMTSLHRAGKHPVDTDTVGIHGRQYAPFGNPSNQHFSVIIQSPMQVTEGPRNDVVAERSDQIESNRLGQNSAYPPS